MAASFPSLILNHVLSVVSLLTTLWLVHCVCSNSACLSSDSQLLDCFTIPVVLLLSWFFLLVRYKAVHFVGVGVCLLGIGCMVGADVLVGRQQGLGKTHTHTNNTLPAPRANITVLLNNHLIKHLQRPIINVYCSDSLEAFSLLCPSRKYPNHPNTQGPH